MTIIAAVMISYDMIKSKIQVSVNLIVNCQLSFVNCQLKKLNVYIAIRTVQKKVNGQLVMLGFDVTTFTPASYQRHRL